MLAEHAKLMKKPGADAPSDEEFEEMKDRLRALNMPDVRV